MRNEIYIAGLFAIIGFGTILAGIYTYLKGLRIAASWPTTTGRVTHSEMVVSRGSRIGYNGYVVFEYSVGAQVYTASTVSTSELLKISGQSEKEAQHRMDNYPIGAMVQVHYDPADPTRAVLEMVGDWSLAIIGLIFIVFALAYYFF